MEAAVEVGEVMVAAVDLAKKGDVFC